MKLLGKHVTRFCSVRQMHLLRALLLEDDLQARQNWEAWDSIADIDNIDWGSFRLLPALYRFLQGQSLNPPYMGILRGIHRKSSIQFRLLYHYALDVIKSLNAEGIKVMPIKGAGLVLAGYYPEAAQRYMSDIDILIPYDERKKAERVLRERGWEGAPIGDQFIVKHAHQFKRAFGEIDLHWHLLSTGIDPTLDTSLWQRSEVIDLAGHQICVLESTYQLLHVICHGMKAQIVDPIRWVADAVHVLQAREEYIDWDYLVEESRSRKMNIVMYEGLTFLRREFTTGIPAGVLEELSRHREPFESVWFRTTTRNSRSRFEGYFALFFHYYYLHRHRFRFPGYLEYVRLYFRLPNRWEALGLIFDKFFRRLLSQPLSFFKTAR